MCCWRWKLWCSKMYRRVFIGGIAVFCKLLMVGHHLSKHYCWESGLWLCCCAVWADWVEFCLPGSSLNCLAAVEFTGCILKSVCDHFLGGKVNSTFKVKVGGTSSSAGVLLEAWLEIVLGSERSTHSVGKFGIGEWCVAHSGWCSSAVVCIGLSGRVPIFLRSSSLYMMHHSNVSLDVNQFIVSDLIMRPSPILLLDTSGLKLRPSCITFPWNHSI